MFKLILVDQPWNWLNNNDKVMVNWADGHPDNSVGNYLCSFMDVPSGLWYSSTCDDASLAYVCEVAQGKKYDVRVLIQIISSKLVKHLAYTGNPNPLVCQASMLTILAVCLERVKGGKVCAQQSIPNLKSSGSSIKIEEKILWLFVKVVKQSAIILPDKLSSV